MNILIKDYLNSVKKELLCSRRLKRYFIKDLKNNILDSNKEFNSIKDLENQFGSPIEIRDGFQELNISHLKRKMRKMLIIQIALIVILILAYLLFLEIYRNINVHVVVTPAT